MATLKNITQNPNPCFGFLCFLTLVVFWFSAGQPYLGEQEGKVVATRTRMLAPINHLISDFIANTFIPTNELLPYSGYGLIQFNPLLTENTRLI